MIRRFGSPFRGNPVRRNRFKSGVCRPKRAGLIAVMKKALFILVIAAFLAAGYGVSAQAGPPKSLSLRIGKSRKLEHGKISIKFIEVVEDSRCPQGVDCIWAGNAKIKLKVGGRGRKSEIIELNTNVGQRSIDFAGRTVKFEALQPYPKSDKKTPAAEYLAVLSVSNAKK